MLAESCMPDCEIASELAFILDRRKEELGRIVEQSVVYDSVAVDLHSASFAATAIVAHNSRVSFGGALPFIHRYFDYLVRLTVRLWDFRMGSSVQK